MLSQDLCPTWQPSLAEDLLAQVGPVLQLGIAKQGEA